MQARDLLVVVQGVENEFILSFPTTSGQQFAQHFSNDLTAIPPQADFEITINALHSRGRTSDIRRVT